jgi:hypothetical protein
MRALYEKHAELQQNSESFLTNQLWKGGKNSQDSATLLITITIWNQVWFGEMSPSGIQEKVTVTLGHVCKVKS